MEREALSGALSAMGCPPEKCDEMADQLLKRAGQLEAERGWSHEEALLHLLKLMREGWAAKARGL